MTAQPAAPQIRRSRGDRQRDAIVTAVRELLQERSFADLSVSTISERAGVARSGFYFYFDSKYAGARVILADAGDLLDQLTHDFAPRETRRDAFGVCQADGWQRSSGVRQQRPGDDGVRGGRNTDAQIREMMDDFADGIIDKIVTLLEQDADARPSPTICLPLYARWRRRRR